VFEEGFEAALRPRPLRQVHPRKLDGVQEAHLVTQSWQSMELLDTGTGDTWVRWRGSFQLDLGAELQVQARATDGTGVPQTDVFQLPQPNGATGWNALTVRGI
jgi:hypothetical protein